jgi:ribosomal protein L40E
MADPASRTTSTTDEQTLAKGVAIGLPLVTLTIAAVVGVLVGPATSILVIAAGLLLGVIAILWASLRVLSGDVPLSPELEALEMATQGVDVLATRKKMLLRALKDLENERGLGKIEKEDYEQISSTYRAELKTVLKRIEETLAPHRTRAEEAARAYLKKLGLVDQGYRGEQPPSIEETSATLGPPEKMVDERVQCPKCSASNEPDAKFCKECATSLSRSRSDRVTTEADRSDERDGEESDEE